MGSSGGQGLLGFGRSQRAVMSRGARVRDSDVTPARSIIEEPEHGSQQLKCSRPIPAQGRPGAFCVVLLFQYAQRNTGVATVAEHSDTDELK